MESTICLLENKVGSPPDSSLDQNKLEMVQKFLKKSSAFVIYVVLLKKKNPHEYTYKHTYLHTYLKVCI